MKQWVKNLCDLLEVLAAIAILITIFGFLAYICGFFLYKLLAWIFV